MKLVLFEAISFGGDLLHSKQITFFFRCPNKIECQSESVESHAHTWVITVAQGVEFCDLGCHLPNILIHSYIHSPLPLLMTSQFHLS